MDEQNKNAEFYFSQRVEQKIRPIRASHTTCVMVVDLMVVDLPQSIATVISN